jgi:hypothetical protein
LQIKMEDSKEYSQEEMKDAYDPLSTVSFGQHSEIKVEENAIGESSSATYEEQAEVKMEGSTNDHLSSFLDCVQQEYEVER